MVSDPEMARARLRGVLDWWDGEGQPTKDSAMSEESTSELFRRLEQEDRVEAAAAERARIERLEAAITSLDEKLGALVEQATKLEPERRSTMSAARKSKLIRSLGKAKYDEISW